MSDTTIRAAVCRAFGEPLQIETLTLAAPTENEIQVKLFASSICHSDITYMDGKWGGTPPIVFGHEGGGIVVVAGDKSSIPVGSRVVVTLLRACGSCLSCQRGALPLCDAVFDPNNRLRDAAGKSVAVGLRTGAFAEQVVVDASQVAVVDDSLPFEQVCLLACGVLTGWGAVTNTANISAGDSVAVIGCGGVGINCLQAANISGATPLVAIDLSDQKLQLAEQFNATHTLNAKADDLLARVNSITDGRGFDYVFMAAGSAKAAEQAAAMVGKMGTLVLVGMPPSGDLAHLDILEIAQNQQRILGSKMGGTRLGKDIPKLIRLHAEGRLNLQGLIAGRYALDDINTAIDAARTGDALRHIIVFPPE